MSSTQFPSGPWIGFFNYRAGGKRHRMDLALTFENGRMSGDGRDGVGAFVITGSYDGDSGECLWTKGYVGAHDVHYRGFREGKGIWGLWELDGGSGGFQIWPLGSGPMPLEAEEKEEWDLPAIPDDQSELLPLGKPGAADGDHRTPFARRSIRI
jgi:hypothetical protein